MSLSHFFSITQTWRIAISWLDTPGRILSSTWYHRWLQLVTPVRQNAQKQSQKFCRSKEGKNSETHPEKPEKGETGCVPGAGEGCSRYGRVGKPEIRTKMHQIAMQHMKKGNRRKPSVFAGFLAGAEGLSLAGRLGRFAAERHWRSLTPRHAVLEWMWKNASERGEGAVLPVFFCKTKTCGAGLVLFGSPVPKHALKVHWKSLSE